ncbi:GNAT family N-acetyltransferase [Fictibacillus barbaricus]|uniref:RimJ/RimL family protein N-acetyltransferase n=1 Tax=Fictibacillus barbaricus TaxID=182136 RepID=A0ABU1U0K5_9BACL|nr:GNAT family N-acetyltransferase [Fictibacillus barbaricus]MDR7072985.1 RimJ/RimL family protein N-acetyltransferase [Fictibacillus barbaricus]
MKIRLADQNDVQQVITLDGEMIGHNQRKKQIETAIQHERCLVIYEQTELAGFLLYNTEFFECCFISLLMIKPSFQRKGLAKELLMTMDKFSPTNKIFSSTNQSNEAMHNVFEGCGYIKSGIIENLDEDDPEIIYFKKR